MRHLVADVSMLFTVLQLMAASVKSNSYVYPAGDVGGRCLEQYTCNKYLFCYQDNSNNLTCQKCTADHCSGAYFVETCRDYCDEQGKLLMCCILT